MEIWQIYDHVDSKGTNVIEAWLDGLDRRARAKCHAKIVALRQYGGGLPTGMLSDTDHTEIKKLRVTGRINWRVLLFKETVSNVTTFTLIDAVYEKDNQMPAGATANAAKKRAEILASPATRRTEHDFEKYKPQQKKNA